MSNQHECTQERFLEEVNGHLMTIIKDDGVHRHIQFKKEDSCTCWFNIITWPGTLCISGDCGTYVFSRTNDMFGFFRSKNRDILINPHYWGEKLESVSRFGGFLRFDQERFKNRVREHFEDYMVARIQDESLKSELWKEIEDEVLYHSDEEHRAYQSVNDFRYMIGDHAFEFSDFFDGGGTENYSVQFIWNLYAIVWGIMKYDEAKNASK
mgnify:FL=1